MTPQTVENPAVLNQEDLKHQPQKAGAGKPAPLFMHERTGLLLAHCRIFEKMTGYGVL